MGNMNKYFVCFFFVLLGVAASFADEGLLRRLARTPLSSKVISPRIFRRAVSSEPRENNADHESSTPSKIDNSLNEVIPTVDPLTSTDSSISTLEDLTTNPASTTPTSMESSSTTANSDSDPEAPTGSTKTPLNMNSKTPSRTPGSDAITNAIPKDPHKPTTIPNTHISPCLDSLASETTNKFTPPRQIGSFSQSSSGPHIDGGSVSSAGVISSTGSFPSRGSFPNEGSYPNGELPPRRSFPNGEPSSNLGPVPSLGQPIDGAPNPAYGLPPQIPFGQGSFSQSSSGPHVSGGSFSSSGTFPNGGSVSSGGSFPSRESFPHGGTHSNGEFPSRGSFSNGEPSSNVAPANNLGQPINGAPHPAYGLSPPIPSGQGSFSQSSSGPHVSGGSFSSSGSFSTGGSHPNEGSYHNEGSLPSRGSFSTGESSPNVGPPPNMGPLNNVSPHPSNGFPSGIPSAPGSGEYSAQFGPNFPSHPGYSSQEFSFPGGSGFASTYTSGPGSFSSAGSFAGASTGFDGPTFLNRGGFEEYGPPDFGSPSGPGASPYPQGHYGYNNPGAYPYQGGFDFQQPFNQYFSNLQAQQEAFQAQLRQQQQSVFEMNNRLGNGSPYGGGLSYGGPQSASASISVGPQGGFQTGQISPVAPGIFSRFAESVPAPSGNSFGVFSSSSSQSAIGPDGKQTSFKSATTGVNDNGRVTYQTVHDP